MAAKRKPKPHPASTAVAVHKPAAPAVVKTEAQAFIEMIERAARDPAIDVTKLKELLAIRNEEQSRVAKQAFAAAMVACQNGMQPVAKNIKADRFKYASLEAVDAMLRPVYTLHGFGLSFNSEPMAGSTNRILIVCDVLHQLGHERRYTVPITVSTTGPKGGAVMTQTQGEGAAVSFGRRYLELMIFNIITTEDNIAIQPENAALVSETDAVALKALIDEAGLPIDKFEMAFGPVTELPISRLQEAKDRIAQYKQRGFQKESAVA